MLQKNPKLQLSKTRVNFLDQTISIKKIQLKSIDNNNEYDCDYDLTTKISYAMKIHFHLCDLTKIINNYFELQLLNIILLAFIIIVFNTYYVLEICQITGNSKLINFQTNSQLIFLFYFLIF